ncbi:theg spermatid protein isoform X1 [Micropterus dolomieu]|uniref:theg spermatid protein isoform X1 n=1 Tax=Micropterus dolomieu TaxID=147949 RepID=UPI001E8CBFAB|nr:theg spermatid protein isoform X1 [Micropterus dolomieu]
MLPDPLATDSSVSSQEKEQLQVYYSYSCFHGNLDGEAFSTKTQPTQISRTSFCLLAGQAATREDWIHQQNWLSPIWEVSEWALRAVASNRLCSLAQPQAPTVGWQPNRPLLVPLNRATQTAVATTRICQLAQPKQRLVHQGSGHKSKPVPMIHLPCKASAHIELLATPKHDHPKFEGERSVCWLVSKAARNYSASKRIHELSSPKDRKAPFEGYDPYIVSQAARSASPSPRILQLCLPMPRKCSSN